MSWCRIGQSRFGIDCLDAHYLHEPLDPLAIHIPALLFPAQSPCAGFRKTAFACIARPKAASAVDSPPSRLPARNTRSSAAARSIGTAPHDAQFSVLWFDAFP